MIKTFHLIILLLICRICSGQIFSNPSLESWDFPGTCSVNIPPDSWSGYTTAGTDPDEGNMTICPSTIPTIASNGNVYARCYANSVGGEGMFQIVSGFVAGNVYQISFDYSGSNLYGGAASIQWHLFIDDIETDQTPVFQSSDSVWTSYSSYFTATMVAHKIGVRLIAISGGTGSGGIDNLSLTNATGIGEHNTDSGFLVFPNPFHDNLSIEINNNEDHEIIFYDITSRILLQQKFTNFVLLNTEQFGKGIYIYEVWSNKNVCKKGKIVKN